MMVIKSEELFTANGQELQIMNAIINLCVFTYELTLI